MSHPSDSVKVQSQVNGALGGGGEGGGGKGGGVAGGGVGGIDRKSVV